MMEGWKEVKLEEIADVVGGGTPSSKEDSYWNGDVNWVTPADLSGYMFKHISAGDRKITKLGLSKSSAKLHPKGTVLMTSRAPIGYLAIAGDEVATNQGFQSLRCKTDKVDNNFLYYILHLYKEGIQAIASGATFPEVSGKKVKGFKIKIPPIPTQRKIASILSAYDDLIENNLKRIKLLEEKAQLTYEEWFVRMKFPGNETTPINKETGLPEGWEKVKASEKIKLISGYAFKGKEFTDEPNEHIAIRMGNFKVGGGLKTDKSKYLVDHTTVREKFHLRHNDLVMVLSDVTREGLLIGNVGFVPNDGRNYYLNQRVSKVELDDNFKMYAYATFNSQSFKHNCIAKANSVTVLNLKNDDVYSYKMLIPAQAIIELWNRNYGSIIQTTQDLERQNQLLKEARDILLPRLMTGMIDVEQMDIETFQPTTA